MDGTTEEKVGSNHERKGKRCEGTKKGVRGTRWRKVNGVGKQDADYVWINSWKRGGRDYQGGLKSDLAQQYNWGQTRNDRDKANCAKRRYSSR